MYKFLGVFVIALALFFMAFYAHAQPVSSSQRDLIPFADSTYDLGTALKKWAQIFVDEVCLGGVCRTSWPSGGSGGGSISTSTDLVNGRVVYATGVDTIGTDSAFLWDSTLDKLTVTNASTTRLSIGSLSGLLKQAGGVIVAAVAGTDYENPLTFTYPLVRATNAISLAFGTSTSNTWGGTQTFTNQISGSISGTAASLAANGTNASAGQAILGVDASGNAEGAFDVWTEAENTAAAYTPQARTLTIAGTANQITSSAGAQSLTANRTWTLSLPSHVIFPGNFQATNSTTTNATTTALDITSLLTFNGVTGSTWAAFCTAITGGAGLCDGTDATGGGGTGAFATSSSETRGQIPYYTSTGAFPATLGGVATTSLAVSGPFTVSGTLGALIGGANSTITWNGLATTSQPASSNILVSNGGAGVYGVGTSTVTVGNGLSSSGASTFKAIDGSDITITATLGTTIAPNELVGQGSFGTNQVLGVNTSAGTYFTTATSSLTVNAPLTTSGTPGALIGGTNLTLDIDDIAAADLAAADFGSFTCNGTSCTIDNGAVSNAMLANSTISGVALGSNLANLTATDSTLTFSGTYNGSAARTIGLNLGNANTWTALQTFANASSSVFSADTFCIATDCRTTWPSGGSGSVTGSTGQVAYLSATDTGVGTSSIFIDTNEKVGIGQTSPTGKLHVENSTHTSNTVVINNGTTGAPPTIPNSYLPTLTVNVSQTSGSRPLFFGYTSAGAWTGYINVGGCGAFTTLCLNFGNGSTDFTALKNNGTSLYIGGTAAGGGSADGNFTNVIFGNSGNVGVATGTPGATFAVTGNTLVSGIMTAARYIITGISSAFTPSVEGEFGFDTTSHQLKFFSGGAERVISSYLYPAFTYSTSTAWTGTTTIPLGPAGIGETWSQVMCFTDAGTLNVSFNDSTNRMNLLNASTTVGTVTLSANNTFTVGEKRYVDVGTPASSPTTISCTVRKSVAAE